MPDPVTIHACAASDTPPGVAGGFAATITWDECRTEVSGGDTQPPEAMETVAVLEAVRVLNNTPELRRRTALIHTASTTIHAQSSGAPPPPPAPDSIEGIFWEELLGEAEGRQIHWRTPDPQSQDHQEAQATAQKMITGRGDEPGFFINLPGPPQTRSSAEKRAKD